MDLELKKQHLAEDMKRLQEEHAKLEMTLAKEIRAWREQREIELEVLMALKEKQQQRQAVRQVEEARLAEVRRQEEEQRLKEAEEQKQREQDEKMRRLQASLQKKQDEQAAKQAAAEQAGDKGPPKPGTKQAQDPSKAIAAGGSLLEEQAKNKEELEEEKIIELSFRVKPLEITGLNKEELKTKAQELWDTIVRLEVEKYDIAEHHKNQDYDIKELRERYKLILRQRALKLGLDPEALTGKYPPKVCVAAKGERREDTRTYEDRKLLYDGGYLNMTKEQKEKYWKDRITAFNKRSKLRLPKWFGERPGRKKDDPVTPPSPALELRYVEDEEEEEEVKQAGGGGGGREEEEVEEEMEEEEEEEEEPPTPPSEPEPDSE